MGGSPWGCKELDMTERLILSFFFLYQNSPVLALRIGVSHSSWSGLLLPFCGHQASPSHQEGRAMPPWGATEEEVGLGSTSRQGSPGPGDPWQRAEGPSGRPVAQLTFLLPLAQLSDTLRTNQK